MKHLAIHIAAALLLAVHPVEAAETYETELSGEGGRSASRVNFSGSCGEECYAASLDCDASGAISFVFGDVEAKIAAAAITRKSQDFAIKFGATSYPFFIKSLNYGGEMYGTWLVTGDLQGTSSAANFTAALGKAVNFKATIGSEKLTLPVTAHVKTWAAACGK